MCVVSATTATKEREGELSGWEGGEGEDRAW